MNRMGAIESDAWTANYNAISARVIGPTNSTLQKRVQNGCEEVS